MYKCIGTVRASLYPGYCPATAASKYISIYKLYLSLYLSISIYMRDSAHLDIIHIYIYISIYI